MRARDNPFATRRVLAVRYRALSAGGWEGILDRSAALGYRGAVVGPEGSGKTTLLEDLAGRLGGRFRVRPLRLARGERRLSAAGERLLFADLSPADLLVVDGADELGGDARRRLLRRARSAGGLLVASHGADLLPTLHACATSPQLLAGIVRDLLAGGGPDLPAVDLDLDGLFRRHAGNLRAALRELYDVYAEA